MECTSNWRWLRGGICGDSEVRLEVGYGNLHCSCRITGGRQDPAYFLMGSLGRLRSLLLPLCHNGEKPMLASFLERPALLPLLHRNTLSSRNFSGGKCVLRRC